MPWHPYRPAPCNFIICYNSQFVKILRGFRENIKMFFFFNCRAMVVKTSSPQISSFPSSFPFLESVASLSLWLSMNLAILCLASSSAILWALSSPHAPSKPGFVFPWPNLVYRWVIHHCLQGFTYESQHCCPLLTLGLAISCKNAQPKASGLRAAKNMNATQQ